MLSFRPTFSLSTLTFIKRLFSSSSLSAIRVVSFHAKMGSIKDRDGMDLTEAEDIKNRSQEYT